jgi:hypothetical protein
MTAVEGAARHLRVWLAAAGIPYDARARELFVRAHPVLFGRESDLPLRGYDRWRWRHRLHDNVVAFARYMAPRHSRWLVAQPDTSAIAPCLIGSGHLLPCWVLNESAASSVRQDKELGHAA